jgi:hypothetical protein
MNLPSMSSVFVAICLLQLAITVAASFECLFWPSLLHSGAASLLASAIVAFPHASSFTKRCLFHLYSAFVISKVGAFSLDPCVFGIPGAGAVRIALSSLEAYAATEVFIRQWATVQRVPIPLEEINSNSSKVA